MLNYIWLALLILGIGAAITTDITNQTDNKFRNGESLPAVIHFNEPYLQNKEKTYQTNIEIKSRNFDSVYNTNIMKNLAFPAKISINKLQNRKSIFFLSITHFLKFGRRWRELQETKMI